MFCVIIAFLSKSSLRGRSRGSTGETALSTCHVGVGSLWSETLYWQKACAKGLRAKPAPQPEIQWTHTESNGYKVCDSSRQVCWVSSFILHTSRALIASQYIVQFYISCCWLLMDVKMFYTWLPAIQEVDFTTAVPKLHHLCSLFSLYLLDI